MAKSTTRVNLFNRALSRIGETDMITEGEEEERTSAEVCRIHFDDIMTKALECFAWPFATKQAALSEPFSDWDSSVTYSAGDTVRVDGVVYESLLGSNTGNEVTDTTYWQYLYAVHSGWEHAYTLPVDCVTPLALLAEDERIGLQTDSAKYPFEIKVNGASDGKLLCTDLEPDDFEVLEYVSRPQTTTGEDSENVDCIELYPRQFIDAVVWALAAELARAIKKDYQYAEYCEQSYFRSISQAIADSMNARQKDAEPLTPSIAARD